jgi:ABC-type polysaccharide/polyol phosphate transport system ATPase subunit
MIDVRFSNVSKRYRVPSPGRAGRTWLPPFGRRSATRDFWAVRSVNLEVAHGEALGVIGRNGAGKSTLLKLLSRITTPTEGEITVNGRLAALIELGSGFHPELTGRENVFLSGSLLGMRRQEIALKLERIIAFSGVGAFIDTPVKWYSSGMYVRLGFSIAAHLEPDILLVDEVLAVGDASFQLQCLDRLNELRRNGTTMLFISHDLVAIEQLCDRVVMMEAGRLAASGVPRDVVGTYQATEARAEVAAAADALEPSRRGAAIEAISFHDDSGHEVRATRTGSPLVTRVAYRADRSIADAVIEVFYYARDGRTLFFQHTTALSEGELTLHPGTGVVEFVTPGIGLQPGIYAIGATIRERAGACTLDWFYGRTVLYVEPGRSVRGYFYAPHEWHVVQPAAELPASGPAGGPRTSH